MNLIIRCTVRKRSLVIGALVALLLCFWSPLETFSQTEKLGSVSYTAPKGWKKTTNDNIVTFSKLDEKTGRFFIITLYGATPATGKAESDFTREWNNLVVKPLGAAANPVTSTEVSDGWTAIAARSAVNFQESKAAALLTVVSGFGKTVSVLSVFNDEAYLPQLVAFSSSMDIENATAVPTQPVGTAPLRTENGRLIIPMPTRQLTVADLAGEWGENAGITTTYVNRHTGDYAGFESLHFSDKMTFTSQGEYYSDFFALQNGKKIKEKTSGTVAVAGRVLVIKQSNTKKYVIRGWLELPDMTIIEVCGPWYNDDVIPAEIFTNPDQGANLDKTWVRKK